MIWFQYKTPSIYKMKELHRLKKQKRVRSSHGTLPTGSKIILKPPSGQDKQSRQKNPKYKLSTSKRTRLPLHPSSQKNSKIMTPSKRLSNLENWRKEDPQKEEFHHLEGENIEKMSTPKSISNHSFASAVPRYRFSYNQENEFEQYGFDIDLVHNNISGTFIQKDHEKL